jgi:hypothetical protein
MDFPELYSTAGGGVSASAAATMAAMAGGGGGMLTGGGGGHERYDEYGTRFTPFELYSHEEAFKRTQQEEGIGYAEKVIVVVFFQ